MLARDQVDLQHVANRTSDDRVAVSIGNSNASFVHAPAARTAASAAATSRWGSARRCRAGSGRRGRAAVIAPAPLGQPNRPQLPSASVRMPIEPHACFGEPEPLALGPRATIGTSRFDGRPRPVAGGAALGPGLVVAGAAAAGSGALALLGDSVVPIVLLGFNFEPVPAGRVPALPRWCATVAALWVAAGMQWAMDRLPGWTAAVGPATAGRPPARLAGAPAAGAAPGPRRRSGLAVLAALNGVAMVALSASAGWPANGRSASDFAQSSPRAPAPPRPPPAGGVQRRTGTC